MSVFKYRITIDVAVETNDEPKQVRDYLKAFTEEALMPLGTRAVAGPVLDLLESDVRAKRLDNDAVIGPELTLRIAGATCPHCKTPFTDTVIERLPFTCPACRKVIRVDADGKVIT